MCQDSVAIASRELNTGDRRDKVGHNQDPAKITGSVPDSTGKVYIIAKVDMPVIRASKGD